MDRYLFACSSLLLVLGTHCSGGSAASGPGKSTMMDTGSDGSMGSNGEGGDSGMCVAGPLPGGPNTLFVSPSGSDSNSGTVNHPFLTLAHAQSVARAAPRTSPITVVLRGGTYYLGAGLSFGSADSGTAAAPVTWQAYPCETPVVSGGRAVTGFTKTSGNLWQAKLPKETVPFESLFYEGTRRLRPRAQGSAGVGFVMQGGKCVAVNAPAGQASSTTTADCNLGTFLRMAATVSPGSTGCPSSSDGTGDSKCLDRFVYAAGDPIAQWANLNGEYTGDPAKPCKPIAGNDYPIGDVEITDFNAWTVDAMRVACIDTTSHTVFFTGSTFKSGGNVYNFFGPGTEHRYIVENAKDDFQSELASGQTGIWFVDRSQTPWVLSYVANPREDPSTDSVVIPQVASPLIAGTSLTNVTWQGITFEVDNFVPGSSGFNTDDNGENAFPGALSCESCANVTFDGITVAQTSATGLQIGGPAATACSLPAGGLSGPACVVVENSAFYDLGDSGIHVGHTPSGSDKDDTVVAFIRVENNLIQGYSRIFADGEGLAQGNGHDVLYTHNDIDDGYHAAISVCQKGCPSSGGGDFNIVSSYNRIWNLMQGITSDGGSLYYNTGGDTKSAAGNQILHNIVHDTSDSSIIDKNGVIDVHGSGYGGDGIYLDNQTGDVTVEDNVVYRVSAMSMWMSGGPANGVAANTVTNNVFAYPRQAIFAQDEPWLQGCDVTPKLRASLTNNLFYFDRNESSAPQPFTPLQGCAYSCGLPYDQFQELAGNQYWGIGVASGFKNDVQQFHTDLVTTSENASVCPTPPTQWTFMSFSDWQSSLAHDGQTVTMDEDTKGLIADPGFANPTYPNDDYTLKTSPNPGFDASATNQTLAQAGRTTTTLTAPVVSRTFPTYSFDPANGF
jgi:hypothetical protein